MSNWSQRRGAETVNNYKNWREQVNDVKWWRVHDWEWKIGACRTNVECAIQQTEPAAAQLKHGSTLTSFKLILKSRESVSVSWIQTVSWIQGRDVGQRKETTNQPSLFVKHGARSSRSDGTWQFRTLYVKRKIVNAINREPETRSWYETFMISFSSLCFCFVKQPTLLSTGSLWNRLLWDCCGVAYMTDCNEREFVCMTNGTIFIYCAVLWLYLAFLWRLEPCSWFVVGFESDGFGCVG